MTILNIAGVDVELSVLQADVNASRSILTGTVSGDGNTLSRATVNPYSFTADTVQGLIDKIKDLELDLQERTNTLRDEGIIVLDSLGDVSSGLSKFYEENHVLNNYRKIMLNLNEVNEILDKEKEYEARLINEEALAMQLKKLSVDYATLLAMQEGRLRMPIARGVITNEKTIIEALHSLAIREGNVYDAQQKATLLNLHEVTQVSQHILALEGRLGGYKLKSGEKGTMAAIAHYVYTAAEESESAKKLGIQLSFEEAREAIEYVDEAIGAAVDKAKQGAFLEAHKAQEEAVKGSSFTNVLDKLIAYSHATSTTSDAEGNKKQTYIAVSAEELADVANGVAELLSDRGSVYDVVRAASKHQQKSIAGNTIDSLATKLTHYLENTLIVGPGKVGDPDREYFIVLPKDEVQEITRALKDKSQADKQMDRIVDTSIFALAQVQHQRQREAASSEESAVLGKMLISYLVREPIMEPGKIDSLDRQDYIVLSGDETMMIADALAKATMKEEVQPVQQNLSLRAIHELQKEKVLEVPKTNSINTLVNYMVYAPTKITTQEFPGRTHQSYVVTTPQEIGAIAEEFQTMEIMLQEAQAKLEAVNTPSAKQVRIPFTGDHKAYMALQEEITSSMASVINNDSISSKSKAFKELMGFYQRIVDDKTKVTFDEVLTQLFQYNMSRVYKVQSALEALAS